MHLFIKKNPSSSSSSSSISSKNKKQIQMFLITVLLLFFCCFYWTKSGNKKGTFPNLNIQQQQHSHYLLKNQKKISQIEMQEKYTHTQYVRMSNNIRWYQQREITLKREERKQGSPTIENIEIKTTTFNVWKHKYAVTKLKGYFFVLKWEICK